MQGQQTPDEFDGTLASRRQRAGLGPGARPGQERITLTPRRTSATADVEHQSVGPSRKSVPQSSRWKAHPLLLIGIGMFAALSLWAIGNLAISWVTDRINDWKYEYPRTFNIDYVVGHGDSPERMSHFIAVNLKGDIVIYELPGGDPTKTKVYTINLTLTPGIDRFPVELAFPPDPATGRVNMKVQIDGQSILWTNDGRQFIAPKPPA